MDSLFLAQIVTRAPTGGIRRWGTDWIGTLSQSVPLDFVDAWYNTGIYENLSKVRGGSTALSGFYLERMSSSVGD